MSEAHCDVDFADAAEDAEPVEFYDSKMVQARKPHRCTECGRDIATGEEHKRVSYRFEGKFETDRICAECHEVAGEFGYAMLGGMLWSNFDEEWTRGANLQGCLNRLETAKAKAHMRAQWTKWQEKRAALHQRMRKQK